MIYWLVSLRRMTRMRYNSAMAAAVPSPLPMRYSLREFAGSLGDLGTFLPLVVAMAIGTGLDLGWMLIGAGLMNVVSGVVFRLPVPVQPMKAIAAVAIAEGLSGGDVVAAGWWMGVIVTVLAVSGLVERFDRIIPEAVVRGIQLGVGVKLAWVGVAWVGALPVVGWDGLIAAGVCGALLAAGVWRGWPMVLVVFAAGFGLLALAQPRAYGEVALGAPVWQWVMPHGIQWWDGLWRGALPQLPLTLLNSVVAVCALSADYFPGRGIAPRRMALSVGLMNLVCMPWSGLPMCHGSGGLAAQYRAGARTGGSVVMLGAVKVLAGVMFGASLAGLLGAYPAAVLGPMVVLAGLGLAHAGGKRLVGTEWTGWVVALGTAGTIVVTQTAIGFALGVGLAVGVWAWARWSKPSTSPDS